MVLDVYVKADLRFGIKSSVLLVVNYGIDFNVLNSCFPETILLHVQCVGSCQTD